MIRGLRGLRKYKRERERDAHWGLKERSWSFSKEGWKRSWREVIRCFKRLKTRDQMFLKLLIKLFLKLFLFVSFFFSFSSPSLLPSYREEMRGVGNAFLDWAVICVRFFFCLASDKCLWCLAVFGLTMTCFHHYRPYRYWTPSFNYHIRSEKSWSKGAH